MQKTLLLTLTVIAAAFIVSQSADNVFTEDEGLENDSGSLNGSEDLNSSKEGRRVVWTGKAVRGQELCTMMYCGDENPCCNTCGADVMLKVNGSKVRITGKGVEGCSGNNCRMNCTPQTGRNYRVEGRFINNSDEKVLKVDNLEVLNP
ncbi:MAG: hypothetical protein ABEJ93_00425 [Candidatus Nanohalobium sp.]